MYWNTYVAMYLLTMWYWSSCFDLEEKTAWCYESIHRKNPFLFLSTLPVMWSSGRPITSSCHYYPSVSSAAHSPWHVTHYITKCHQCNRYDLTGLLHIWHCIKFLLVCLRHERVHIKFGVILLLGSYLIYVIHTVYLYRSELLHQHWDNLTHDIAKFRGRENGC